jgi:hypothetical protein
MSTEPQQPPIGHHSKRKTRPVAWIGAGLVVVVFFGPAAWLVLSSIRAEKQARAFCAEVVLGNFIDGLDAKARDRELLVQTYPASEKGPASTVFIARGPYSARCIVDHEGGKVVRKETYSNK